MLILSIIPLSGKREKGSGARTKKKEKPPIEGLQVNYLVRKIAAAVCAKSRIMPHKRRPKLVRYEAAAAAGAGSYPTV